MKRRTFLSLILFGPLLGLLGGKPAPAIATEKRIHLQTSPIAGFQYHDGPLVWPHLENGQPLELRREPFNPYDKRAVAIYWQGHKVGYVPRRENKIIAQLLDSGETLKAKIVRLKKEIFPDGVFDFAVEVIA